VAKISYEPIGVIHSPFKEQARTPIHGVYAPDSLGEVEVFPQYLDGLKDVAGFSHLILIYHFHLAKGYSLVTRAPFLFQYGISIAPTISAFPLSACLQSGGMCWRLARSMLLTERRC